jgi:hypothetical protein
MFSIPTRIQGLWIFLYVALNVIFCCVGYDAFDGNMLYATKTAQILKYVADRTGIIAWYNLPLLWLLAGRNDFLLWLTGCSYATLQVFHRWAARITALQALVHSAVFIYMMRQTWDIMWGKMFWRTGFFAIVVVLLMIPLSIVSSDLHLPRRMQTDDAAAN